ncbi:MAG: hypothetical protein RML56_14465 [Burkholderiales bacterium]|nr:hypothetical protein [Burkholderiales bacterium]
MAGEFFVTEKLFRLGYEPALTLGNAKTVDILVRTKSRNLSVSVKSARGGGKWGVDENDLAADKNLVFVFLLYKNFEDVKTNPEVWVMPASDVDKRKRRWFKKFAIYYSHKRLRPHDLDKFKDAWHYIS